MTADCVICGHTKLRVISQNTFLHKTPNVRCVNYRSRSSKEIRADYKNKVYDHYGRECKHCGENDEMSLTIDHVNNDGTKHRSKLRKVSSDWYRWIVMEDFPIDLQILCANCNLAKARNGGILPEHRKDLHRQPSAKLQVA